MSSGLLQRIFGRSRSASDPIVIVSGLPRSGTSMLMGMLAAGGLSLVTDGLRQADDDNPLGYYEYDPVKHLENAPDRSWVASAHGKGVKVISHLLAYLPDRHHYKIIFVRRDLREVLASQRKMLERCGEPAGAASDEEMARLFERHLKKVEAALVRRPNCDVLYVNHADALRSPRQVAEAINRFLGGSLDETKMAAVVDGQLYRNRAQSA